MVLEVVSDSSVRKDKRILPDLYWRAGIPEYWLVDARGKSPEFTIFKHGREGYTPTRPQRGGWLKSDVFGRSFRLCRSCSGTGRRQRAGRWIYNQLTRLRKDGTR